MFVLSETVIFITWQKGLLIAASNRARVKLSYFGHRMTDSMDFFFWSSNTGHIAFSSTVAKYMPKSTMFSEFTDEP